MPFGGRMRFWKACFSPGNSDAAQLPRKLHLRISCSTGQPAFSARPRAAIRVSECSGRCCRSWAALTALTASRRHLVLHRHLPLACWGLGHCGQLDRRLRHWFEMPAAQAGSLPCMGSNHGLYSAESQVQDSKVAIWLRLAAWCINGVELASSRPYSRGCKQSDVSLRAAHAPLLTPPARGHQPRPHYPQQQACSRKLTPLQAVQTQACCSSHSASTLCRCCTQTG